MINDNLPRLAELRGKIVRGRKGKTNSLPGATRLKLANEILWKVKGWRFKKMKYWQNSVVWQPGNGRCGSRWLPTVTWSNVSLFAARQKQENWHPHLVLWKFWALIDVKKSHQLVTWPSAENVIVERNEAKRKISILVPERQQPKLFTYTIWLELPHPTTTKRFLMSKDWGKWGVNPKTFWLETV